MIAVIRIRFPKRDPELGRRRVEEIPPGRDALVVWRDQFGTIHMASFGRWAKRKTQDRLEATLGPLLP